MGQCVAQPVHSTQYTVHGNTSRLTFFSFLYTVGTRLLMQVRLRLWSLWNVLLKNWRMKCGCKQETARWMENIEFGPINHWTLTLRKVRIPPSSVCCVKATPYSCPYCVSLLCVFTVCTHLLLLLLLSCIKDLLKLVPNLTCKVIRRSNRSKQPQYPAHPSTPPTCSLLQAFNFLFSSIGRLHSCTPFLRSKRQT